MIWEMVRVGVVTQVYPERGAVRVKLTGVDNFLSYEMPVVFRKTLIDYDYWMPDVNEQVLCLFLNQGIEQGFVIGSFYSQADPPPINSKNKWHKEFMDGTVIEYDRAAHKLTAQVQGNVELTATGSGDIAVQGDVNLVCGGDLAAQAGGDADIEVTGDLAAQAANIEATATAMAKIAAPAITLAGAVTVQGDLLVQGNINATGQVIDVTGNTANHSHS